MIRSRILWIIFAIVIAVAFLSVDSCQLGSSDATSAGRLGGKKVSIEEYEKAQMFVNRTRRGNEEISPSMTETQIWEHIAAVRTAKEMGIVVSPDEIRAAILNEPAFQTDNQFDLARYESLISQNLGLTASGYENLLCEQITIQKLMRTLALAGSVSQMELDDKVAASTDTFTFQYATISNKFTTADIKLDDDALEAYYEENKKSYALPDRVAVRYAEVPVTNYFASISVTDDIVEGYYDDNIDTYTRQTTNGTETIPLAEVSDSIRRKLMLQDASFTAMTNLTEFVSSLSTNDIETFTWRAKARGMRTADTGLIADTDYIPGVESAALSEFREVAADLDAERAASRCGMAVGEEHVYILRAYTNDAAHTPTFSVLKDSIRPAAIAAKRRDMFRDYANVVRSEIVNALTNATFEAAAGDFNLNVSTSLTFSVETIRDASAIPNARAVVPAVIRLQVGEVSEPISIYNGMVLAYVSKRIPCDVLTAETKRNELRSTLSGMSGAVSFPDWLSWNLKRIGFTSDRVEALEAEAAASEYEEEEE